MADQTEQMNMLLRDQTGAAMAPNEMEMSYTVDGKAVGMKPSEMDAARASGEIQMITNAQMGLMEMDPAGTKDVVDGLEMTKQKVMSGGALSEGESSGIMAILQKLGGALSGMMSGGETKSYMVDGKVVEMTDREMMGAKNAGILVQDVESGIRDMEMNQQEVNMAEVNVENMEENAELFMEKMGFAHDSEGLDMTDDQLVNFLLLCHHMQYGVGEEEEMMEEDHDSDVKVKIMKVGSGDDVHSMMNQILGG